MSPLCPAHSDSHSDFSEAVSCSDRSEVESSPFLWSHVGTQVSRFGAVQILGFWIRDAQPSFSSPPRVHGFLLGTMCVMGGLQGSKTLLKLCVKFPCAFFFEGENSLLSSDCQRFNPSVPVLFSEMRALAVDSDGG